MKYVASLDEEVLGHGGVQAEISYFSTKYMDVQQTFSEKRFETRAVCVATTWQGHHSKKAAAEASKGI